ALDSNTNPKGEGSDAAAPSSAFDRTGGATPNQGPQANGLVLVHGALFPSFRLCFENFPEMPPQPDNTVMPEANVVGVEIGSLVRINPLSKAPGKIYLISESAVRSPAADTTAPKCVELLGNPSTENSLTRDNEYHVINT